MPRKKETDYDFIGYRCEDLDYTAKELDTFKKNFKKGKVNMKELTDFKRTIVWCSKEIKKYITNIKKKNLRLN